MSSKEVGPRERQLREMREAKLSELESASADVRRKERTAVKSAGIGKELIAKINEAAQKRGKKQKDKK